MSLKGNLKFYASQETSRFEDEMHPLSNKSKFNLRSEASLLAADLKNIGARIHSAKAITAAHAEKLVSHWQEKNYAASTVQAKITSLRHVLHAAGNPIAVPAGTPRDGTPVDKSAIINAATLEGVKDLAIRSAIRLAATYGLRKKAAIYTVHALAGGRNPGKAGTLAIQGSWAKNGRAREFKMVDSGVVLQSVRAEITQAKLDLKHIREEQFRGKIDRALQKINAASGQKKVTFHGLRHAYAQQRYATLTGMAAPVSGGLKYANMTKAEQAKYMSASQTISRELGHNRADVSRVYLGK